MAVASALPESGREPSQAGLQPPDERMNAMVNHLTPVAFITVEGLGGFPQPMYRYGAPPRTASKLSLVLAALSSFVLSSVAFVAHPAAIMARAMVAAEKCMENLVMGGSSQ